jgi:hypothetical protein
MLIAVGLTPAVLFSLEASADATAKIAAWAAANVPDPAKRTTFIKAAGHLWKATKYAMGSTPLLTEDTIVDQALLLSAQNIVTNLDTFIDGFHQNTMGCAGMCGYLCVQQAHMAGGKITPLIYRAAFFQVQAYIASVTSADGPGGLAC